MKLSAAEQKKLSGVLKRTSEAIEEVIVGGLTAASESTHKTLAVTFREVSRLRLLRLGGTLRNANDEIARFVKDDERFSQTRLMFFLNRCWIMCRGIERAMQQKDSRTLDSLLMVPTTEKRDSLDVVCLGVAKKVVPDVFCAFEFRLRDVDNGERLIWSTVFPMKPGAEIPAEGYLHLPQKQKFTPSLFLEKCDTSISNLLLAKSNAGPRRIQLTEESTVEIGNPYQDWDRFLTWNPQTALTRIQEHQVSPFDVDIELHEEAILDNFDRDEDAERNENRGKDYERTPILYRGMQASLAVSKSVEGDACRDALNSRKKQAKDSLYGLMYYSDGEVLIQPLTLFENEPTYITISKKSFDRKSLLKALKFT